MSKSLTTAQVVVAAGLLGAGGAKLAGQMKEEFEHFGYPPWFRIAVGIVETAAAANLLAGLRDRRCALAGSILASGTMAGAVWTHLFRTDDPPLYALPAGALLGLSCWIAAHHGTEGGSAPARVNGFGAIPRAKR